MPTELTRRTALKGMLAGGTVLGLGGALGPLLAACSSSGKSATGSTGGNKGPIKIGALTDLTGAFGVVGVSNKAVAEMTVKEINDAGGVLGRQLQLITVDSASDPSTGATVARQLIEQDKVSMVIGGVASNMREAIKGVIAGRGKTLYIWPASYEGGECDPNVWSVGAVPNQQVDPTVEYLMKQGAKTFFLCGDDYSYPRTVLKRVREKVEAAGGKIVGEEYVPLNITDTSTLTSKVLNSNADALFEIIVLPATASFIKGVVAGGYKGLIASTLFDESINPLFGSDAQGLISVQDYFQSIDDSFSAQEVKKFQTAYPKTSFAATFNSPAWYRGLKLWAAAVQKAGTLDLNEVNKAMDGIGVQKLIGGPAKMAPGTRHCTLTMYLGQMQANGSVKVLKDLGQIVPVEC